jgi:hypothetical protein
MNLGLKLRNYMDQTPDNVNGFYAGLLINMELLVQAVFVEALGIVFVDAFDMAHQPLF